MPTKLVSTSNLVKFDVGWLQGYCTFLTEEQLLQAVEVGHVKFLSELLAPACRLVVDACFYHRFARAGNKVLTGAFCN